MDDQEFHHAGEVAALLCAVVAACRAHPNPRLAAQAAVSAVEALHTEQLNKPEKPDAWLGALQDMSEQLQGYLDATFDE